MAELLSDSDTYDNQYARRITGHATAALLVYGNLHCLSFRSRKSSFSQHRLCTIRRAGRRTSRKYFPVLVCSLKRLTPRIKFRLYGTISSSYRLEGVIEIAPPQTSRESARTLSAIIVIICECHRPTPVPSLLAGGSSTRYPWYSSTATSPPRTDFTIAPLRTGDFHQRTFHGC